MPPRRPLMPFGPALLVFLTAAAVTAGVVVLRGEPVRSTGLAPEPSVAPSSVSEPATETGPQRPTPTVALPTATATAPAAPSDTSTLAAPTTPEAIVVQVLIGTEDIEQVNGAVAALEELEYEIVDREPATRLFEETTVFYTEGHEADAEALRDADPRFAVVEPAIEGLDASIPLHVVVGTDWPSV